MSRKLHCRSSCRGRKNWLAAFNKRPSCWVAAARPFQSVRVSASRGTQSDFKS